MELYFLKVSLINQVKCNFMEQYFGKLNNKIILDTVFENQTINSKLGCAKLCSNLDKCWYFSYIDKECKLYNKFAKFNIKPSNQSFYYEKIKYGLEYYWPVHNSSVKEIIQGVDLTGGVNVSFTEDRFGNPNSAISLNSGYYVFPKRYYFGGEITIMAWVRTRIITPFVVIFDLGNGAPMDNIGLVQTSNSISTPYFQIFFGSIDQRAISSYTMNINSWYHITGVYKNNLGILYINGSQIAKQQFSVNIGFRNNNFIGKSNWNHNFVPPATADYDEIKIYNRALNDSEIKDQYENPNL